MTTLGETLIQAFVDMQQQILRCAKDDSQKGKSKVKDEGPDPSLRSG